jgi:hypothetical protein
MFSFFKRTHPKIEFLCEEDELGNIPSPYPSRKYMPEWYKALPMKMGTGFDQSTLKRCPPFLDAMVTGWIIPLVADVYIESNEDCSHIKYDTAYPRPMIENHSQAQVTSDKCPAPHLPKPPIKWMNYWAIKCPKGYSLLFTPPMNRTDPRFTCFSGIVECDGYFEYINFPFVWNEPNFKGIVPAGTPLMQVIPIKRNTLFKDFEARAFNENDYKDLRNTRHKRQSHESHYRDTIWERK